MNNHSFNEEWVKGQSIDDFKAHCTANHKDLQDVDVIAIYNSIVPPTPEKTVKGTKPVVKETPAFPQGADVGKAALSNNLPQNADTK